MIMASPSSSSSSRRRKHSPPLLPPHHHHCCCQHSSRRRRCHGECDCVTSRGEEEGGDGDNPPDDDDDDTKRFSEQGMKLLDGPPITRDDASNATIQYAGWTVPKDNYTIPAVEIDDNMTPEKFYEEYIQKRRPIVLTGLLPDLVGIKKWRNNNNYLLNMVGEQSVVVERRSNTDDAFGRGNKIQMNFQKFLQLIIHDNDERHYLTTQDVVHTTSDDDGRAEIMSPLMKALEIDFPLRPTLMGNLVPQNINLWIGNAKDGASSGLHHDYHDNLYIVLRGRKQFRLYSPIDANKMYTSGELLKVHSNGRINYRGEETTACGADPSALAAWRKLEAERMLEDAERAVAEGKPKAQEQVEQAELLLDLAMDAVLDAEIQEEKREHQAVNTITAKLPNNFSKVDVKCLNDRETLKRKYPKLLDANAAFCNLEAGSILYLPASWFHEVTSYGGVEGNGHMAMNYWFHPPDGDNFAAPYSSDFWPNDFIDRFDNRRSRS